MADLEGILRSFTLKPAGDDRYTADNVEATHGVIFGGQLLAQTILAALEGTDGKRFSRMTKTGNKRVSPHY